MSLERKLVIELATKYEQGAIYHYMFTDDPCIVRRHTVPVLMPEVEADVNVVTSVAPPWANAKVD